MSINQLRLSAAEFNKENDKDVRSIISTLKHEGFSKDRLLKMLKNDRKYISENPRCRAVKNVITATELLLKLKQ